MPRQRTRSAHSGERERGRAEWHDRLRRADRRAMLARVAGDLAHQLGTPLNVIAGRAALIAAETQDQKAQAQAGIIVEQTRRMTGMIRQLVEFSRKTKLERRPTSLSAVMDQARELILPIAQAHGIEVRIDDPSSLTSQLDAERVLQVLTNVMINAIAAMREGGQLTVTAELRHVAEPRNDYAEPGMFVVISVRDDGTGIDAAQREHLFRAPWQCDGAEPKVGMGLYVSQGVALEQGGWIELRNDVAQGSAFDLFLPDPTDRGTS